MILFPLDKYPGVELLDNMMFFFFFFEEPPHCFPQWLHQSTFPPTVQEGSVFSTPSPAFVSCPFDDGHSDGCEVLSHCGFDLHFSDD